MLLLQFSFPQFVHHLQLLGCYKALLWVSKCSRGYVHSFHLLWLVYHFILVYYFIFILFFSFSSRNIFCTCLSLISPSHPLSHISFSLLFPSHHHFTSPHTTKYYYFTSHILGGMFFIILVMVIYLFLLDFFSFSYLCIHYYLFSTRDTCLRKGKVLSLCFKTFFIHLTLITLLLTSTSTSHLLLPFPINPTFPFHTTHSVCIIFLYWYSKFNFFISNLIIFHPSSVNPSYPTAKIVAITLPHVPRAYKWLYHMLPGSHIFRAIIMDQFEKYDGVEISYLVGEKTEYISVKDYVANYLGWNYGDSFEHSMWALLFIGILLVLSFIFTATIAHNKR